MNFKTFSLVCISLLFATTACIKEEGLDREADILSITLEDEGFLTSIINEDLLKIYIVMEGDVSKYESGIIVPIIKTSSRATVSPKSYEPAKLENYNRYYEVKSEDGNIKKYQLTISTIQPLVQGFEDWYTVTSGVYTYDAPENNMWGTANPGVVMLYRPNAPFPTRKSTDKYPESEGDYSVVLETVKGEKGMGQDIPLYSGNMFTGRFDLSSGGISEPLKTTKFGQPHPKYLGKPIALTAWYKYKPGDIYQTWDKSAKTIGYPSGVVDKSDIYAVLFKVTKGAGYEEYLTALDIKTSEDIVATAFMSADDKKEKADWTRLVIKFSEIEALDYTKNDYKLAVILASSDRGAHYEGAIGSVLTVDDLRVVFERDEDADLYK